MSITEHTIDRDGHLVKKILNLKSLTPEQLMLPGAKSPPPHPPIPPPKDIAHALSRHPRDPLTVARVFLDKMPDEQRRGLLARIATRFYTTQLDPNDESSIVILASIAFTEIAENTDWEPIKEIEQEFRDIIEREQM